MSTKHWQSKLITIGLAKRLNRILVIGLDLHRQCFLFPTYYPLYLKNEYGIPYSLFLQKGEKAFDLLTTSDIICHQSLKPLFNGLFIPLTKVKRSPSTGQINEEQIFQYLNATAMGIQEFIQGDDVLGVVKPDRFIITPIINGSKKVSNKKSVKLFLTLMDSDVKMTGIPLFDLQLLYFFKKRIKKDGHLISISSKKMVSSRVANVYFLLIKSLNKDDPSIEALCFLTNPMFSQPMDYVTIKELQHI